MPRCAVELRHRSWSDEFGPTLTLLHEHHAAFVQIDEPKFSDLDSAEPRFSQGFINDMSVTGGPFDPGGDAIDAVSI
jgi:hypothetical protein